MNIAGNLNLIVYNPQNDSHEAVPVILWENLLLIRNWKI